MTEQDPTLNRMQSLAQQWSLASDRRVIFLDCYLLMTGNMLEALKQGEFHDSAWVKALLDRFAGYYFAALDGYEQGSTTTPSTWKIAFDAAGAHQTMTLQNLFLGINAHVNYDLVLALVDMLEPEWDQLSESQRAQRYADHCHVNAVIGRTTDEVEDRVVDQFTPAMEIVDKLLGPVDEWVASELISHWRDVVWQAAVKLIETPGPDEKHAMRQQIEAETMRLAHLILLM